MSSSAIATLVKIMESLPETLQDRVVEYLQEYILKSNITVTVNPDGKLEIPAEIEAQLKPEDRYTVTVTADNIVFQKIAGFDWEEWERRVEAANPDRDELTKEEICELVREVRRETGFDWEELRRHRESLPPDPNPMTMEEICEIVREVRGY
jgi:bifunctional DNA-binding transcriptional regulator/antitoxin component of YhaV-PrlF toxin-antitoxin module